MRGSGRYAVCNNVLFEEDRPQAACTILLFLSVDLYSYCTRMSFKFKACSPMRCLIINSREALALVRYVVNYDAF